MDKYMFVCMQAICLMLLWYSVLVYIKTDMNTRSMTNTTKPYHPSILFDIIGF